MVALLAATNHRAIQTASLVPEIAPLDLAVLPDAGLAETVEPRPVMMLARDEQPAAHQQGAADDSHASSSAAELQLLRDRVTALEQQLQQARTDSRSEVLQDLDDQVADAREQLAEKQARREARAAEAEELRADRAEAIDALLDVEDKLAVGDADVAGVLDQAAPVLPAPAQRAVATARDAIEQEDLFTARYWIGVAIRESERTELRR